MQRRRRLYRLSMKKLLLVNDFEHSFRIEATAVHRCARKITEFASR